MFTTGDNGVGIVEINMGVEKKKIVITAEHYDPGIRIKGPAERGEGVVRGRDRKISRRIFRLCKNVFELGDLGGEGGRAGGMDACENSDRNYLLGVLKGRAEGKGTCKRKAKRFRAGRVPER